MQVWALQDPNNEPIIQRGILHFNTDSGTGARLTTYANDSYKQKLQATMGTPAAPDVFFNWGGGNLAQYVRTGKVRDLSDALKARPDVAKAFLPSVLAVGKIDNGQYGLPMNGIQPVILFYNRKVFADAGAEPPRTYDDLLALVDLFKSRGVTPIALAGSQGWTELMWLEYLLDRVGGASRFADIAAGKAGAWKHPDVKRALTMCQDLAKAGAFGPNFATVDYDKTGASRMLATGKAAMHLMGSWEYANQGIDNPAFIARKELGWVAFPAVTGGKGDARSVVGNPSNYFSVRADSTVGDSAVRFVVETLASDTYIEDLIGSGQVPAVKGVEDKLVGKNADFARFTYQLAVKAPTFTQSWDQALSPAAGSTLNTSLQKLFLGDLSPDEFTTAMEAAK
ncbi:extracellular solute-binding protein [Luedemannella helvata]|uniref:Extracellular solute-binding protein n=1 Tax=Luedemannella helvata TaxID=349315 RepID=A0ABN2L866_9ACTN